MVSRIGAAVLPVFVVMAALGLSLLTIGSQPGHASSAGAEVHWQPAEPVQGTGFVVRVHVEKGREITDLTGSAAGERLHFTEAEGSQGMLWALAAAPLDRGARLDLRVDITYKDGAKETHEHSVAVRQGDYVLERLTVAPQFVAADPETTARQARERELAAEVSQAAHAMPRRWTDIVLPRDARITSAFGSGREFNGQVQSRHTGVDFAGSVGAPVHAAADGIVALVDSFHLAGNVIYINHGAGLVTGYFHLSEALVGEGDEVVAGDLIARVGMTGRVTGPHLHWLVRYGHTSIDGLSLIGLFQQP